MYSFIRNYKLLNERIDGTVVHVFTYTVCEIQVSQPKTHEPHSIRVRILYSNGSCDNQLTRYKKKNPLLYEFPHIIVCGDHVL